MAALHIQHIVEDIISLTADFTNASTLTACALVCSTWRDCSRRYVLRQVKLSSEARLGELTELLDQDHVVHTYIRVLVVQPATTTPFMTSPWVLHVPQILASRLPRVHTIHFDDLVGAIDTPFVEALAGFTSVDRLFLSNNNVDLSGIAAIAAALPNLRHLYIRLAQPRNLDFTTARKIHLPELVSLHIDAGEVETFAVTEFLEWLTGTPSLLSLRSLRLEINFSDAEGVGRFLQSVGPRLEELELKLEMVAPTVLEAEVIRSDISLAGCNTLRSLAIRHPRGPMSRAILELLEEDRSSHLKCLTLGDLTVDDLGLGNGIDSPGELPNFAPLADRILPSVQDLTILISGTLESDAVTARLRHDLPNLETRCRVSVRRV